MDRLKGRAAIVTGAASGIGRASAEVFLREGARVIATDMLPMPAVPGVEFVLGDFREPEVFQAVLDLCQERAVDVLLSDMAPNLSGVDVIDQPRAMHLAELALEFAGRVLKPQGCALIKVFQGAGFEDLVRGARVQFAKVKLLKPQASRSRSPELYLLAKAFVMV